jgi:hypothetical protein
MRLLANLKTLVVMAVAVAGIASRSDAGVLFPAGLNPGDKYRLVFVTSTTTVATSSDISYYNSFVTNVADAVPELLALNATWTVIGSTSAVSAATNIGATNSGIYRLDGLEVAAGTAALFATGTPTFVPLMNPPSISELGDLNEGYVWTGSDRDGTAYGLYPLGNVFNESVLGYPAVTDSRWLGITTSGTENSFGLYAISSELTVGGAAPAPEPATIGFTALGGAFLLLALRRKQQNHMATRTDRTPPAHH